MQDNPEGAASAAADHEPAWTAWLRNVALIVVVLAMAWIAFNVDLPPVDQMQAAIESFGWAGWFIFIGVYGLVALTPIPVTIMAVTAGLLFGLTIGSLLSVIGAFLGAWGAYWLARALGKRVVIRMLGRHRARVQAQLTSAGFEAVCMLRLMPGVPYWPVNYGSGAFGVRSRIYVPASLVSMVPGQLSLVAVGHFIAEPGMVSGTAVLITWAVVAVLTVLAYRRWRAARRAAPDGTARPGAAL